jgi:hypothetical protein
MSLDLKAPGDAVDLLKGHAANQYCGAIERYAKDLLAEASRLEAANRGAAGHPEITSTMVGDADILLRRGYKKARRKPGLIVAQLVATVGSFLAGILADMDALKDSTVLVVFIVALAITIAAAVVALVTE